MRVHLGRDEPAYRCIFQEPDSQGRMGVALSKDIVHVAAKALTTNLTRLGAMLVAIMVVTAIHWWEAANGTRKVHLIEPAFWSTPTFCPVAGPLVLPWSEKLMFAANWVARFFKGKEAIAAYVPDFTKAFDHFCLHAGARAGTVVGRRQRS